MKVQHPNCWFFCGRCKPIQPAQTALPTPQPQSHQQGSYVLQSHLWRNERIQHWDTRFSIITKFKIQEASLCNKCNEWWYKMKNYSYPLYHEIEHILRIFIDLAGLLPVEWIDEVVGFGTAVKIGKGKMCSGQTWMNTGFQCLGNPLYISIIITQQHLK